jgi:hypothetical protein
MLRNVDWCLRTFRYNFLVPSSKVKRSKKNSSSMLRIVDWQSFMDVSERPIGPIFRSQIAQEELFWDVTHRRWVVSHGRLGTNCLSHLQGYSNPRTYANCYTFRTSPTHHQVVHSCIKQSLNLSVISIM